MTHHVTLIPGDGIGPEVCAAVVRIVEAAGVRIEWERFVVGGPAQDLSGSSLPDEVIESVRRNRVALKGPVETPIGSGFESVNVRLSVVPSGNLGEKAALFEAVHGTAPDIAGKNLANPTALLLSAIMMLRHIGERTAGDRIESALNSVLEKSDKVTRDLGGTASTGEFTVALIAAL